MSVIKTGRIVSGGKIYDVEQEWETIIDENGFKQDTMINEISRIEIVSDTKLLSNDKLYETIKTLEARIEELEK